MVFVRLAGFFTLSCLGTACSIHPLPQDVARSTTVEIVQKIRCEAREAIIDVALNDLGRSDVKAFLSQTTSKDQIIKGRIDQARKFLLPGLQRAAIGYSFKFSITEGNGASGGTLFEMPFSNGSVAMGVSFGEDKKRKSERSFDLAEEFSQILADVNLNCEPGSIDWRYPITGEIGLKEVIATYVRLSGLRIFPPAELRGAANGADSASDSDVKKQKRGAGQSRDVYEFTDELTFTTTYNAAVEPKLELKPVAHDFRLTKASALIGGRREDVHSVTVALKAGEAGDRKPQGLRGTVSLDARGTFPEVPISGYLDPKASVLMTLQNKKDRELKLPDQ
jgi:hypothetical protein